MKNKLICQTTNYDCGPTCLTNALRFLFEREEIPPLLLRQIWAMGNDAYSDAGEPGKAGTSLEALRYLGHWFTDYGEKCNFPLRAKFLEREEASVEEGSAVVDCLRRGGCVMLRVVIHGGSGHYVLLTRILDGGEIGLFDPYDGDPDPGDPGRRHIGDRPLDMNRAVRMEYLNLRDDSEYAMGPTEKRELLLLWRADRDGAGVP